ncbi:MAG: Asp-tRNA(Asn)/Glu-tRNA(Gln) amidotransferase subunit GatC [Actinobacteria bacterium]|nr:Asp-tRNA(Asn)/Glu-tRNA(Gln) amidotransferase subunit GatC [Actinomycetota bacterium]
MKIISGQEVRHIAKLAELDFSEEELSKITSQLDDILEHVAIITRADTSGAEPTSHTLKISNVFREDKVRQSLAKEDALKNAPERCGDGFLVPKID